MLILANIKSYFFFKSCSKYGHCGTVVHALSKHTTAHPTSTKNDISQVAGPSGKDVGVNSKSGLGVRD